MRRNLRSICPLSYNAWFMPRTFRSSALRLFCLITLFSFFLSGATLAQQVDPSLYSGLCCRMIGPFRGGRINAVIRVAGQPNRYFFSAVGGGVWQTTNGRESLNPIFYG